MSDKKIPDNEMKALLASQQGELDAVLMYRALAEKVEDPADAEVFTKLAAEEGRHALVFRGITGKELKPVNTKALQTVMMIKKVGREKLYGMIAKSEYEAYDQYAPLAAKYPAVESVRDDEKRHGDMVMSLLGKKQG
jgi:rubrerythrin